MAVYYFRNVGTDWGVASNWSTTDGGVGDGSVPSVSDDAYFTINSGNCEVTTSIRGAKDLNFTGYTGTITMTFGIIIQGNVTLSPTMTILGTGALRFNASGLTHTSNGKAWPGAVMFLGSNGFTNTFADDWTVLDVISQNNKIVNGGNLNVTGGFNPQSGTISGTITFNLIGTGTWTGIGVVNTDLTINTAGTITIDGTVGFRSNTLTYVTGTVITAGSFLVITGAATFDTDGMVWDSITFTLTTGAHTLLSDLHANSITVTGGTGHSFTGFTIYTGSLVMTAFMSTSSTNIVFNGTGTWSGSGNVACNVEINTAGTLTLSGAISWGVVGQTKNITYTSGTVISTGSTLTVVPNVANSSSLDLDGMSLNNLSLNSNMILTLTSDLIVDGTMSWNGPSTLNGSTVYVGGNLTGNSGNLGGSSLVVLDGNGTWSGGNVLTSLRIDTLGTITLGTCAFGTGTFTYVAGTVVTSGSSLRIVLACSLDVEPITWPTFLTSGNTTITLLDDLNIVNFTVDDNAAVINGFTTNVSGNFTIDFSGTFTGTTHLKLIGTGNLTTFSTLAPSNFTIDTAGTITFVDDVSLGATNFTVANGTLAFSGVSLLQLAGTTINATASTYSFVNISLAPGTVTLSTSIRATGNLTFPSNSTTTINGNILYIGGGITITGNNQSISGTTNLILEGTGTVSVTAGRLNNALDINTAGTITISNLIFANGPLKYTTGTVVTTGSTLTIPQGAAITLDTNGVTWNNVTFVGGTTTATVTSKLTVAGVLSCANPSVTSTFTFNGAEVQCATLATANPTTIQGTSTMRITTAVTTVGSSPNIRNNNVLFDPGAGNTVTIGLPNGSNLNFGSTSTSYTQVVQLVSGTAEISTTFAVGINAVGITHFDFPNTMFDSIGFAGTSPIMLLSDVHVRNVTFGVSTNSTTVGKKLYCYGSAFNVNNTSALGNSELVLCGTGTWSSGGVTGFFTKNVTIDTPGVITMGVETRIQHARITYKRGKVVVPTGRIFEVSGACEIYGADKIPFHNVHLVNNATTPTSIKVDKFFQGTADRPVVVRSTGTAQYNVGIVGPMSTVLHAKMSRANVKTGYYSANNNLSEGLMNGLQAYYKLDGASNDLMGRSNGVDNAVTYVQGRASEAGSFNGSTSRVTIADQPWLQPTTGLTMSLWMNTTTNVVNTYILSKPKGVGGANGWDLGTGAATGRFRAILVGLSGGGGPGSFFEVVANVYDGQWHHVCMTYGSNEVKIYVDGVSAGTWSTTGTIETNANSLVIGTFSTSGIQSYAGLLDEVGIWDRGLSQQEVIELYSNANDIRNFGGLHMPTLDSNQGFNTGNIIYGNPTFNGVPIGFKGNLGDITNTPMLGGSFLSGGISND